MKKWSNCSLKKYNFQSHHFHTFPPHSDDQGLAWEKSLHHVTFYQTWDHQYSRSRTNQDDEEEDILNHFIRKQALFDAIDKSQYIQVSSSRACLDWMEDNQLPS